MKWWRESSWTQSDFFSFVNFCLLTQISVIIACAKFYFLKQFQSILSLSELIQNLDFQQNLYWQHFCLFTIVILKFMIYSLKYLIRLTIQLLFHLKIMALLLVAGSGGRSLVCFTVASHCESESSQLTPNYTGWRSWVPILNLGRKGELLGGVMHSMKFPLWYHQAYFLATATWDFIIQPFPVDLILKLHLNKNLQCLSCIY